MSCLQLLVCIFCPPLAVINKGCGSVLLVAILCCFGWVPGVIAALILISNNQQHGIVIIRESAEKAAHEVNEGIKTRDPKITAIVILVVLASCCFCCAISGLISSLTPKNVTTNPLSYTISK